MNYAEIKECDIANGVGVRTSLFVSGCRHRCPGCFNDVAWDFLAGNEFTAKEEDRILDSLRTPYVEGLSVLGGEPLEPENQLVLAPFLERVRREAPKKDIWLWTGFVYEELGQEGCRAHTEHLNRILACLDVMVDGPFVEAQKDITLRFRGSANQRIIDVQASWASGHVVPWQDERLFSSRSW